ncbi:MAG: hypothetical protein P4M00_15885 [Azospirillaceae bacterium]|nr:hypothetical protein [Azospirillaceae bacterium]
MSDEICMNCQHLERHSDDEGLIFCCGKRPERVLAEDAIGDVSAPNGDEGCFESRLPLALDALDWRYVDGTLKVA